MLKIVLPKKLKDLIKIIGPVAVFDFYAHTFDKQFNYVKAQEMMI